MKLLDSLLDAIVRLEGDALVMHVGEKPYIITASASMNAYRGPLAWGQVELSSRVLTFDALSSMLAQILPADQRRVLDEMGAIEHEILPPDGIIDRFTVVAARGGEDVWVEVRRKPMAPVAAVTEADAPSAYHAEPIPPAASIEPAASEGTSLYQAVDVTAEPSPSSSERLEVHEYSARIDLPSLSTSIEPEPAAEAPAAVESADSEAVETIVVALPGEDAEAVSLDAAHDAIQIVDEEVQGLPTEEEVDAMMGGAASALLTSGLTVDHVADEATDLEATAAADAVEDQDDGEIVDLDEIEIDAPMLLDVNDASAAGYELSIAVAQEPGIATDVMRPDAEAPAETATASEPSIPVETGGGEVDVLGLAEPEPDRAEILEAVVYDLPTRQDDSPIETQAVILPFTPSSTAEFSPIAMGQSTADEFTGRTDAASPEFSTGQVVAFEAYTAAPIVAPIEEPPSVQFQSWTSPAAAVVEEFPPVAIDRRGSCLDDRAAAGLLYVGRVGRRTGRTRGAGRIVSLDRQRHRCFCHGGTGSRSLLRRCGASRHRIHRRRFVRVSGGRAPGDPDSPGQHDRGDGAIGADGAAGSCTRSRRRTWRRRQRHHRSRLPPRHSPCPRTRTPMWRAARSCRCRSRQSRPKSW